LTFAPGSGWVAFTFAKNNMPSQALRKLRKNIIDARRLEQSHGILSGGDPGKKGLSHITRSGILILCACWEEYAESALIESARYMAAKTTDPNHLPLPVRKKISLEVKEALHELKPLELAGDGWRSVYDAFCCNAAGKLNTPKSENLKTLYKNFLGVEDITVMWSCSENDIDNFVTLRGSIAHKGRYEYVKIGVLSDNITMIYKNCLKMDRELCDYLHSFIGGTVQPWRKAYK
jgi:hypothetical protein